MLEGHGRGSIVRIVPEGEGEVLHKQDGVVESCSCLNYAGIDAAAD